MRVGNGKETLTRSQDFEFKHVLFSCAYKKRIESDPTFWIRFDKIEIKTILLVSAAWLCSGRVK